PSAPEDLGFFPTGPRQIPARARQRQEEYRRKRERTQTNENPANEPMTGTCPAAIFRTMSFVHLHCHSEYSLLDGANRVDDLIRRAQELEQPALAITDHGNLHAAWDFQEK